MKNVAILFLLTSLWGVPKAHGNAFFDTFGLPVIGSTGINSDRVEDPRWVAQRFTTDDSQELTVRRINFVAGLPLYSYSATITIHDDLNNAPSGIGLGQLWLSDLHQGTNSAFGSVALQPNTSYWALFQLDVLPIPYANAALLDIVEPSTDFGLWGKYPDDADFAMSVFLPDSTGQFFPSVLHFNGLALRMEISSVPEPSMISFAALGLATHLRLRRWHGWCSLEPK